jgi:hypothetical protein
MNEKTIDTFICIHRRDVGYLLELVLRAYRLNFRPKGQLVMISNDRPYLQSFLAGLDMPGPVTVYGDEDWLSQKEMSLPGWYRQQIIKLRAYRFCQTENFCNLGADTVLLRPVEYADLVQNGHPVLYYTRHRPPDQHWLYEWQRVGYTARILQVRPAVARRYVDFINDLFCFNGADLNELNRYLEKLYGPEAYYNLLREMGDKATNQKKFGEWTLYSLFLLEVLKRKPEIRNSAAGYLRQVHSSRVLKRYQFDSKVVHFVAKSLDVNYIKQQIIKQGLELGQDLNAIPIQV